MHNKKLDDEHTLYCKAFLNKEERAIEKEQEKRRYKNSKKRCNLYVKNFPKTYKEEDLRNLF